MACRIVIAEDDAHILRVISLWLTRQGHTVFEAWNGQLALELIRTHIPDILVTDVNMPVMDGIELLEALRNDPVQPRGIVVLTNRWDHREIGETLATRGVHVIPKPFSPTNLADLISQMEADSTEQALP